MVEPVVVGSMVAEAETVVQATQEVPVDVQDQTTRPEAHNQTDLASHQEGQGHSTTVQVSLGAEVRVDQERTAGQ